MINFIGLGAQKAGTSWVYACLYEHPEICAPIKELHFFSRERFANGKEWYENHFSACKKDAITGEFSTSYLYSKESPNLIKSLYPEAKLIVILRHPVTRAYSQYYNAIKAGEIKSTISFKAYCESNVSVLEQGNYAEQLSRYYSAFPKSQLLVLLYEDIEKDPRAFMRHVYKFLGVDPEFEASMVDTKINTARVPKLVQVDRLMHRIAERMRVLGFDKVVHLIRRSGLPDIVRAHNTARVPVINKEVIEADDLTDVFRNDVRALSTMIGRDVSTEWNI